MLGSELELKLLCLVARGQVMGCLYSLRLFFFVITKGWSNLVCDSGIEVLRMLSITKHLVYLSFRQVKYIFWIFWCKCITHHLVTMIGGGMLMTMKVYLCSFMLHLLPLLLAESSLEFFTSHLTQQISTEKSVG